MGGTEVALTRKELREQQQSVESSLRAAASPGVAPAEARAEAAPKALFSTRFDAVDGMRGIAIISVLLYHCGWSTRGLFGVDAFFVVSGFLITLIMIREATTTGRIRVGRFYARRAKRLLPSLFLTMAAVLLIIWSEGTLEELKSAGATAIASVLQIANWHQIGADSGYWDQSSQIIPLGQMWSLSVTEQFYLFWPLVVLLAWVLARKRPGALAIWMSVALVGAALVAPLQYDGTNSDRLYLGTDSRIVAFVAGAAAAALVFWVLAKRRAASLEVSTPPTSAARFWVTALSIVSLVAVVGVSIATDDYHEGWLYQGGFAAVAIGIAVFTATLCFPANALIRPFSWKPFRVVGVVSYSMFLLHLPVFWLVQKWWNYEIHPLMLFVVGGVITWLASMFLHHLVAEPLRTRTWKPVGATISIIVGVALVVGLAWYLPIQRLNAPKPVVELGVQAPGDAFVIDEVLPFPTNAAGGPLNVAVIGDSVAGNMYAALAEYRTVDLQAVDVTFGGCGIFDATQARADNGYIMESERYCWPWKDKLRAASAQQEIDVYVLHNLWDADDQLHDGTWMGPCTDAWASRYASQLELLVSIGDEQERKPLILLSNDRARDDTASLNSGRLGCKTAVEDSVIAAHDNVHRLDFQATLCPDGTCVSTTPSGAPLYTDGAHFGPEGLALLAPWLQNEMARGIAARG